MIFYFSGTGNTRWAVDILSKATGEKTVFIPDVVSERYEPSLVEGERIGFCFPVHGWQPPTLVREFIRKLSIDDASGRYVYSLVTAGDNIGETMDILRNDLIKKDIPLHSVCSLIMPESYVGLPFMDVDSKEKERTKIMEAKKQLEWFADLVDRKVKGAEQLTTGRWPKTNSRLLGSIFYNFLITDKHFHIDAAKCIGCGRCTTSCSVDNIEREKGGTPKWKHNGRCMTCFNCYHHCPTHAIEFGKMTKNKGQYFFGHRNEEPTNRIAEKDMNL